ncbi:peptide deformylase [Skermanella pratensis]|uniref:peptide deformylase n=1 Tax=Skermanella pratensis TaxID=2233999 RepID=UPI0013010EBD|nr:peptide deformylase [Skermanella pratensis]
MAILKIARMGHPVLRRVADPVEDPSDPEIQRLIADMAETMADASGAGLAAPQVHVPKRIILFIVPAERATMEGEEDRPRGLSVLINPVIELVGTDMVPGWEGCLSIPGLRGIVPRHAHIRYRGLDAEGRPVEREASGFHARVVQHELDHLDGVLYPDRMPDLALLTFNEETRYFPDDLSELALRGRDATSLTETTDGNGTHE